MSQDATGLERFIGPQAETFEAALAELRRGRKQSHWMWFIFPQLRGLGHSATSEFYGIASLDEARRYLAHPILGPRLRECAAAVNESGTTTLSAIFGSPDDLKFRSSMTLFALADGDRQNIFARALERWCGGAQDERTLALLACR